MLRLALVVAGAGLVDIAGADWACAYAPTGMSAAAAAKEQAIERQVVLLACISCSP
jgi:hypothetical protein